MHSSYVSWLAPFCEKFGWYLTTAAENVITPSIQSLNSLNNARKKNRGAVLAKPFPCLVSQWVTQAFDNNYSQL